MYRLFVVFFLISSNVINLFAEDFPPLKSKDVQLKIEETFSSHASQKKWSSEFTKRVIKEFIHQIDPCKCYFLSSEVNQYLDLNDAKLELLNTQLKKGDYSFFIDMGHNLQKKMIQRPFKKIGTSYLKPNKRLKIDEFEWLDNETQLNERRREITGIQNYAAGKLRPEDKEKAIKSVEKRRQKFEDKITKTTNENFNFMVYTYLLKAFTSSLDAHTSYFTPFEAQSFLNSVKQKLTGIGVQLRDDLDGFTITKLIEGTPAYNCRKIKLKDRIVAINQEPVLGWDIFEVVEKIRGKNNTPVNITLIRTEANQDTTYDIDLIRNDIPLEESRLQTTVDYLGDRKIAILQLNSFYQDGKRGSAQDIAKSIIELNEQHQLEGVILDLRHNSGGLLTQAIEVCNLFLGKGVITSIKDSNNTVQHLRHLESNFLWDGPLMVLISRASASASEIVAQCLQDYGRALIVGDDHSFGKGSFQSFTLDTSDEGTVNPLGEVKVTRGRYYTVSGKSPQLTGVFSDIIVPGVLNNSEVGEAFSKYPLSEDQIEPSFKDTLLDIPFYQRESFRKLYAFNLQTKLDLYGPYLEKLKSNSHERVQKNKSYQKFIKYLKSSEEDVEASFTWLEDEEGPGMVDFQLYESINIFKDLIHLTLAHPIRTKGSATNSFNY